MTKNEFASAVLKGLSSRPKWLPPKYFYDREGSLLFERICECPEYYIPRVETRILEHCAEELREIIGPGASLFEFGSGMSRKTRVLLRNLRELAVYVPVDISPSALECAAQELRGEFPGVSVRPLCADFMKPLVAGFDPDKKAAFLPGSTIGNLDPAVAEEFLANTASFLGRGGYLLIGVDLVKRREVLEAAYNDAQGWTAAFNRNILRRIRDELEVEVDPTSFEHRAFFNSSRGRIEMHLISRSEQRFRIDRQWIEFRQGESIHTENSYKYHPAAFESLVCSAGFEVSRFWTDPESWFGVFLLRSLREEGMRRSAA